jgi:hypothetical protein
LSISIAPALVSEPARTGTALAAPAVSIHTLLVRPNVPPAVGRFAFRGRARLLLLGAVACSPSTAAEAPASPSPVAEVPASPPPVAGAAQGCVPLPPRHSTSALSAAARRELEASRDGEHFVTARFEPAMARLLEAARGGQRVAQAVYGQTRFATLFGNEAPQVAQRAAYVEAIMFCRTAALADRSAGAFTDITAAQPIGLDFPLSELPAEWLREAWAKADAWVACHGLPW